MQWPFHRDQAVVLGAPLLRGRRSAGITCGPHCRDPSKRSAAHQAGWSQAAAAQSLLTGMGNPSCYGAPVPTLARGEVTTSRINRRALLLQSGSVVVATTVEAMALDAPRRGTELAALIEAHRSAYAALGRTVEKTGSHGSVFDKACRTEEEALLAICAHPSITEGDRLAKASYLLQIEARGELDLPQHMQALLRSAMWKA